MTLNSNPAIESNLYIHSVNLRIENKLCFCLVGLGLKP